MNIAVLAANGRTGKEFVKIALEAGHNVRAGVYKNNNLTPHKNLSIVECDATSEDDVAKLIEGQDAVVSFIGHVKGSPRRVQTQAMRVLVKAMSDTSITRVVSLTGTGVRFPGDNVTFADKILNLGISLIDPNRVKDGIFHAEVLKNSDLEWTIVRVLKLFNTKPTAFTLRENGPTKLYVSRIMVAKAVLDVLETHKFVKRAPIIGNYFIE